MPFCCGGGSAAGKVVAGQQARLVGEHERQHVGAVALNDGGQGSLIMKKRARSRDEQLGAFDMAMGGGQAESGGLGYARQCPEGRGALEKSEPKTGRDGR